MYLTYVDGVPTWSFAPLGYGTPAVSSTARLNKNAKKAADRQLTLAGENAPIRFTYGRDRIGGLILNVLVYGSNVIVQVLWGMKLDSIESVTYNGEALPSGASSTDYTGTQSSADATLVAAFAAQSPSVTYEDTLAGYAYSVFSIPKDDFRGGMAFEAIVKGRKVYDPREVGHDPDDDSTWEYSDNPALALGDFLKSSTYGAGLTVDWSSVETTADACDALLEGEATRLIGLTVSGIQRVNDVIEQLRTYAGCFVVRRGATMYLVPDAARSSDATYAHASGDIASVDGLEKRDIADAPTITEVIFTDTSQTPWRDRSAYSPAIPGETVRRLSTVRLPGVQRYSQAYREAVERQNKLTLYDLTATITVWDRGVQHEPGDVITVTLPFAGVSSKLMRVTNVQAAGAGKWQLSLQEYDPAVYSTEVQTAPTYGDTTFDNPNAPDAPSAVSAAEEVYQLETGLYASRARITVTAPSFDWIAGYRIEVFDAGDLISTGTITGTDYATPALQDGVTYSVRAYTISTSGAESAAATTSIVIQGKALVPGDVDAITGFEVGGDVYLAWDAAVDVDIWRYELRWGTTGDTWATATLLDRIDGLRYISKGVVTPGVRRFFVKAIDSIGQYSDAAAYVDVTVTLDPDALQIEYYPDSPSTSGMQSYTERDGTVYDITSVGTAAFETTFGSALSGYTEPIAAYWGGTSSWEGDAEDPWGATIAATWDVDSDHVDVGTGTSTLYLRLGTDGTNFTDYSGTDLPTKVSARYARAKITTSACVKVTRGGQRVFGNAVTRTEYGSVSVPSTGTTVTLTGAYFARRNILLTPVDNGTGGYYGIADNIQLDPGTGANTFDIYLFDTGGNLSTGTCDYRFEGI